MKTKTCKGFAKVLFLSALLAGCSNSGGDSPTSTGPNCSTMSGSYIEPGSFSYLEISNTCTFTDSVCGYDATYTFAADGFLDIDVNDTNGTPGCMSNSVHTCEYQYTGLSLIIYCDADHNYLFQRL